MTTDTPVQNLKINTMTQAQYATITPSSTELYMVTDSVLSSNEITTALGYTPANTTLSNLSSTSSTNFDGQWVSSFLNIASSVTWKTNTAVATYSLANYLPNDNYNYEVLFVGTAATGSTSGNFVTIGLNSDLIDNGEIISMCEARTRTTSTVENRGNAIIPIGTGRWIKQYSSSSNNANGTYSLWALAYRRIGTNS